MGLDLGLLTPHPRIVLQRSRIQVWLYEQVNMRIEGCIIGFDEYMNLVLDDAEEIHSKTKSRKQLGTLSCLCSLNAVRAGWESLVKTPTCLHVNLVALSNSHTA
ncbi:UNVERIFIED_CONTAM: hypothetical protein H355_010916 [Colinus virginianus]|nr:hypothetical protein H355_010916 [Colinus virginianus]